MDDIVIGIPVHNDLFYFRFAIESIIKSSKKVRNIVIVESGSTDGSKEYCDLLPVLYPNINIEIIHTKKLGPLNAYNILFTLARERRMDLYLTQTDVIHFRLFQQDWLEELYKIAQDPKVGLIGPIGSFGRSGPLYYDGINWIGGWACYVPLRTNELIGGYDENYEIGDGVDIDYSYNVVQKGLKLAQANFWIQHHWKTAHVNEQRKDLDEIKKRNGIYFRKKFKLGEYKE